MQNFVKFKKLTEKDWNQFNLLASDAFGNDYENLETYQRHLLDKHFIGYFEKEELLGYCLFRRYDDNTARINSIATHSKVRNQGIGTEIMRYILSQLSFFYRVLQESLKFYSGFPHSQYFPHDDKSLNKTVYLV